MVGFDMSFEFIFWCIWICRQMVILGRGYSMSKGKEFRNFRCVNNFFLLFVFEGGGGRRQGDSSKRNLRIRRIMDVEEVW